METLLARQSIFDARTQVVGYELLFRQPSESEVERTQSTDATAVVSVRAMLDIGLDRLVGSHSAYINGARSFFVEGHYLALPPDRVVLEVLEDIAPDREFVASVRRAKDLGYRIALDDFIAHDGLEPLIELADIIKVDLRQLSRDELSRYVARFRRPQCVMLAEKIETHEEFEFCAEAGYDLFQGFFFCKPTPIVGRRVEPARQSLMNLLDRLQDAEIDVAEIERLIASNALLAYKLLVYVNSAVSGVSRKVDSVRHAIVMLGLERVRTSVLLLLLSGFRDKPTELTMLGFVRARMCQLLGRSTGTEDDGQFLTVGLLSVLDALMDQPLDDLLEAVSLPDSVCSALLTEAGPAGRALAVCRACEMGEWERALEFEFDARAVREAYLGGLAWAAEMDKMLQSTKR